MSLIESIIRWSSSCSWQATLAAHVAILGLLTYLLVRSTLRQSPYWANRVWLVCAAGLLVLPALQFVPIYTLSMTSTVSPQMDNRNLMDSFSSGEAESGESLIDSSSPASIAERDTSKPEMPADAATQEQDLKARVATAPTADFGNSSTSSSTATFVTKAATSRASFSLNSLIGLRSVYWIYGLVACGLLLRLLIASLRLRRLYRQAIPVSEASTLDLLDNASNTFLLRRTPILRESKVIHVPVAFGLSTSKVLVPEGFARWPEADRRAVLYHELAHVSRWDIFGELLARLVKIVYWFHPVAWLVADHLRQSQELAADQRVIEAGLDRATYARALLNVISKIGSQRNAHDLPVLAMSSMNDVQQRVTAIMCWSNLRNSRRGLTLCALLMIAIGVSTIRVQLVAAMLPQQQSKPEIKETTSPQVAAIPPVEPDDNDLIRLLSKCEVLTVTGKDHDGVFNLSGVVVNTAGEPLSGAVVVLRESTSMRVNVSIREGDFKFGEDRWKLLPDVFARTLSDDNGRFEFKNIKAPSLHGHWTSPWRGSIVAGHDTHGVGWSNLRKKVQSDLT